MRGMRLARKMSTLAEIKHQFAQLNDHIAGAIADKNFSRAMVLDKARQDIIQDLCLMDGQLIDESFITFLEECASKNAELVQQVEDEMIELSFRQSQSHKVRTAYSKC